jgi:sulfotransferase
MKKTLHFLSGIPRSGSTVLAAILNQNPNTHVSTTSGLVHALDGLANTWHSALLLNDNDPTRSKLASTMRGTIDAFYEEVDKPVVIDKSRGWPIAPIMQAMTMVLGHKPKIIATVRSVPDCAASFIRIAKPDDLDEFMNSGQLMDHLRAAYISLQNGYIFAPECFLFIEYEDLVTNPKKELERIHDFLGIEPFSYDFNNVDGESVKEDDEQLHGTAGMHDVKPKVERQHNDNPRVLLKHHYGTFCQPEFWLDKPRTVPEIHDLDLQLAASTTGNFVEGWRLCQKIEKEEPHNHRAAYNRGWYLLYQEKIQKGYQLMDRGRIAGVFGDKQPDVPTPMWDGKSKGIVLLHLEGGLGDQIHQIRFAKDIAAKGCKVIVACTGQLASLFIDVEGVSGVIQHEAAFGIYHNFWVAGMSAIVPLGFELLDISGKSYISKPTTIKGVKKRIGLRWQGSKHFEHEHKKEFPHELMFDAVNNTDAEFISLQRDDGEDAAPGWVRRVPLNSWEDTRAAIASCDLVISACTSVAHLSGAMGIPTWVITPVMPYFLWASPGDKTPYYDSITVIRQEVFENWQTPFDKVKSMLPKKKLITGNWAVDRLRQLEQQAAN